MAGMARGAAAAEAWRLLVGLFLGHQQPRMRAVAENLGLTPAHVRALLHLDPDEPRPMRGLAALLQCDASHVTGLVDRLEERGYVVRRQDPDDRRVRTVAVTDAGWQARRAAQEALHEPPPELTALPAADQAALRDLLRRVVEGGR